MRSARCGGAWAIFPAGALADTVRLRSGRDCTALRTAVPHYPLHITGSPAHHAVWLQGHVSSTALARDPSSLVAAGQGRRCRSIVLHFCKNFRHQRRRPSFVYRRFRQILQSRGDEVGDPQRSTATRAGLCGDAGGCQSETKSGKAFTEGGRAGLGSHGTSVPVSVNAISGYWLGP